jgi:hypothetical protein
MHFNMQALPTPGLNLHPGQYVGRLAASITVEGADYMVKPLVMSPMKPWLAGHIAAQTDKTGTSNGPRAATLLGYLPPLT